MKKIVVLSFFVVATPAYTQHLLDCMDLINKSKSIKDPEIREKALECLKSNRLNVKKMMKNSDFIYMPGPIVIAPLVPVEEWHSK